jgi:hypothetical protein
MAWQAVEAEIAREMRDLMGWESLEDLLYWAWLYGNHRREAERQDRREGGKDRWLYRKWSKSEEWCERRAESKARWREKRSEQGEADRLATVLACAECRKPFQRSKFAPKTKRYCSRACGRKADNRAQTGRRKEPTP